MRIIRETGTTGALANFRTKLGVSESLYKLLFKKGTWNDIVRAAIFEGGQMWLDKYLPLRFTPYARGELNYLSWRGRGYPVDTGRLRKYCLEKSRVEAVSTSSSARIDFFISSPSMLDHSGRELPRSYYANKQIAELFKKFTAREVDSIAETASRAITLLVEGATPKVSRKGRLSGELTTTQRKSISHTRATRPEKTSRAA